jgi:hypothetical protein
LLETAGTPGSFGTVGENHGIFDFDKNDGADPVLENNAVNGE